MGKRGAGFGSAGWGNNSARERYGSRGGEGDAPTSSLRSARTPTLGTDPTAEASMTAPSSTASSSHQNPLARSHACRSDGMFRASQSKAAKGERRRCEPRRQGIRTLNASMASPSECRAVDRARLSGEPRLLEGGHSRFPEKVTRGEPSPRPARVPQKRAVTNISSRRGPFTVAPGPRVKRAAAGRTPFGALADVRDGGHPGRCVEPSEPGATGSAPP